LSCRNPIRHQPQGLAIFDGETHLVNRLHLCHGPLKETARTGKYFTRSFTTSRSDFDLVRILIFMVSRLFLYVGFPFLRGHVLVESAYSQQRTL